MKIVFSPDILGTDMTKRKPSHKRKTANPRQKSKARQGSLENSGRKPSRPGRGADSDSTSPAGAAPSVAKGEARTPRRRFPGRTEAPERPIKRESERRKASTADGLWFYGSHAVLAALANPRRGCRRLLVTREAARQHGETLQNLLRARQAPLTAESAQRAQLESLLPEGAVHQGLALRVEPLPALALEDLLDRLADGGDRPNDGGPNDGGQDDGNQDDGQQPGSAGRQVIVALDQVTDPRNVGAILRSAAAFGALAVIAPARHTAPASGALAKAASGALEALPYIEVSNLVRALAKLKAAGFWCLGLAGEAGPTLAQADTGADPRAGKSVGKRVDRMAKAGAPLVLVLGAEGKGLRRLTRENCDALARLPTRDPIASLNVSNAAAVALYQVLGH